MITYIDVEIDILQKIFDDESYKLHNIYNKIT